MDGKKSEQQVPKYTRVNFRELIYLGKLKLNKLNKHWEHILLILLLILH